MTITRAEIDALNDGDMVTVGGYYGTCVSGPIRKDSTGGVWLGDRFVGILLHHPIGVSPTWSQQADVTLSILRRAQ